MFKYRKYNWQDGKQLELKDRTLIMGILNGTPDSFSDGGRYNTSDTAVAGCRYHRRRRRIDTPRAHTNFCC